MLKCLLCQSELVEDLKQIICSSCYGRDGDQARAAGYFLFEGRWSAAHGKRDPAWDLTTRPRTTETQSGQPLKEFILSQVPREKNTSEEKSSSEREEESVPWSAQHTIQPPRTRRLSEKLETNCSRADSLLNEVENVQQQPHNGPAPDCRGGDLRLVELVRLGSHGVHADLSSVSPLPQKICLLAESSSKGREWYRYSSDNTWHVVALARGNLVEKGDVQVAMTVTHNRGWDESERQEGHAIASPDSEGLYWFRVLEPLVEGRIDLSFTVETGEELQSGVKPLRHEITAELAKPKQQQPSKHKAPPPKQPVKRPVSVPARLGRGQPQLRLTRPDGGSAFARQRSAGSSGNGGGLRVRGEKRNVQDEDGEKEDEGWISGDVTKGTFPRKSQKQLRLSSHFLAR